MSSPSVLFDYPGPRARRWQLIIGIIGGLAILALLVGLVWGLRAQLGPTKWAPLQYTDTWTAYFLPGLLNTVKAAALAVIASTALGLILGILRLSHVRIIGWLSMAFVEFFRSVPVLMMMLFAYYALLNAKLLTGDALSLAGVVIGLTLYNASVMAELIRAGVHALPTGQREAGMAIGLRPNQVLLSILLPQSISAMLPSLVSQLVVILKDTALGYLITYPDLLRSAQYVDAVYGNLVVGFLVVGIIFFVLNWSLTRFAHWLESSMRSHRAPETLAVVDDTALLNPEGLPAEDLGLSPISGLGSHVR